MHFLSIVEDTFEIQERGTIVVSGVPRDTTLKVRMGDTICLVCPDESRITAQVSGIDYFGGNLNRHSDPILFKLTKSQIPIGTKLYLIDQND
jgi:hypothetical protein